MTARRAALDAVPVSTSAETTVLSHGTDPTGCDREHREEVAGTGPSTPSRGAARGAVLMPLRC